MIKTALQYLVSLGKAEVQYENGQAYSDKELYLLESPTAAPFTVHTLTGLVDYLKSYVDGDQSVIVHVASPTEVRVESALNKDAERHYFLCAEAIVPEFRFDSWYDTETFNIKLQSVFIENDDRNVMLKVVGNIKEEMVNNYGDDGVSQSVVAKAGVASVANVEVPNPVSLKPYRTFAEVMQPESDFVFRMKDGPRCAIFEADGGVWKNLAIENIKDYLNKSLEDEIKKGRVTLIA